MIVPVETQLYYFLSTMLGGMLVGCLFDIYRVLLHDGRKNKYLTAASDFLFWILCGLLLFQFFLFTNGGSLRYYTFIGLACGGMLYFGLFSAGVCYILSWIRYGLIHLLRVLLILVKYPIKLLGYLIKYSLYFIHKLTEAVFSGLSDDDKKEKEIQG